LFFFSSRRRHTIFSRDWSSDVCSSDLPGEGFGALVDLDTGNHAQIIEVLCKGDAVAGGLADGFVEQDDTANVIRDAIGGEQHLRSEERRVGKECRSPAWAYHQRHDRRL